MTALVGILNLTPDSFSDGGAFLDSEVALSHAERMITDGASVIDVGAESTRPGATPLAPEEEWSRLAPVLSPLVALAHRQGAALSLDTRHAATAQRALACGVDWINDVNGAGDAAMQRVLAASVCRIVVMHALGIPADRGVVMSEDADVMEELRHWFMGRIHGLEDVGIETDRLILDPGIGFGKTARQSREILERIGELSTLGLPILIGHSRKSFLNTHPGATLAERDLQTLEVSRQLMAQPVHYLRVHNVAAHATLLKSRADSRYAYA